MGRRSCRVSCSFPRLSSRRREKRRWEEEAGREGGQEILYFVFCFSSIELEDGRRWTRIILSFFFRRKEERAVRVKFTFKEKLGEIKKIVGSVRLFENMVKIKRKKSFHKPWYLADRLRPIKRKSHETKHWRRRNKKLSIVHSVLLLSFLFFFFPFFFFATPANFLTPRIFLNSSFDRPRRSRFILHYYIDCRNERKRKKKLGEETRKKRRKTDRRGWS